MKNKEILYICDIGSSNRTGGGQTFALNLLKILQKIDHFFLSIICILEKDDLIDEAFISKYKIPDNVRFFRKIGFDPFDFYMFNKILNKEYHSYQNIILSDCSYYIHNMDRLSVFGMFHGDVGYAKNQFNLKQLLHPRQLLLTWGWRKPFLVRHLKTFIKTQHPLYNSVDTYSKILKTFGIEKNIEKHSNSILYLPVDTDLFSPSEMLREKARLDYGIHKNDIVIAYITNFTAEKKRADLIPDYVESFLMYENVKFLFVGRGGQLSQKLEKFCETHKNKIIRITQCDYKDTPYFFNSADIMFTLTTNESFGYTVAEGMSCSKPTIIFPNSALSEYTIHMENAIWVHDKKSFVDSLELLIHDEPLRKKIGHNAREQIKSHFSFDAYKRKIENLIFTKENNV